MEGPYHITCAQTRLDGSAPVILQITQDHNPKLIRQASLSANFVADALARLRTKENFKEEREFLLEGLFQDIQTTLTRHLGSTEFLQEKPIAFRLNDPTSKIIQAEWVTADITDNSKQGKKFQKSLHQSAAAFEMYQIFGSRTEKAMAPSELLTSNSGAPIEQDKNWAEWIKAKITLIETKNVEASSSSSRGETSGVQPFEKKRVSRAKKWENNKATFLKQQAKWEKWLQEKSGLDSPKDAFRAMINRHHFVLSNNSNV